MMSPNPKNYIFISILLITIYLLILVPLHVESNFWHKFIKSLDLKIKRCFIVRNKKKFNKINMFKHLKNCLIKSFVFIYKLEEKLRFKHNNKLI
ncbi:hypothetical protein Mgra_00005155 [Meloidogyne graminicola]|uniref:Uncharacterized protein n=1 Tax=Meloidogyne graminicola TaxID=189291 RepID=A0A8S9ZPW8_9BILA|nr:hypothetical protein Mgra_00005155 [Meloidogyne graminicola]